MIDTASATSPARTKVPQVTALFWVVKLLTTAMGESCSDYLSKLLARDLALALTGTVLVVGLIVQLCLRRYSVWAYWFAVVMVSIFGTMAADFIDFRLHVPLPESVGIFLALLICLFGLWYATEKTLSMHSITSGRREMFYWAAVIITFMLGTAAGDLTAGRLGLGYRLSILLFALLIALPAVLHRWFGLAAVPAFWFAYVVTRPLGASISDWLASHDHDGVNLGTGPVTLVAGVVIVALVTVMARRITAKSQRSAAIVDA
ncbi:COG4705 family protein [Nocardia alni]|uniref:COG4705 family protein n=1 Tax=Nocardia alni TaxID=2815723 RepID=UPI0027E19FBC|nr:hypothetical protein [Nocardia alni]